MTAFDNVLDAFTGKDVDSRVREVVKHALEKLLADLREGCEPSAALSALNAALSGGTIPPHLRGAFKTIVLAILAAIREREALLRRYMDEEAFLAKMQAEEAALSEADRVKIMAFLAIAMLVCRFDPPEFLAPVGAMLFAAGRWLAAEPEPPVDVGGELERWRLNRLNRQQQRVTPKPQ